MFNFHCIGFSGMILCRLINSMQSKRKYLENRLLNFTCIVVSVVGNRAIIPSGLHVNYRLVKSCPVQAYKDCDVQSSRLRNDLHKKLGVLQDEIRESRTTLNLISKLKKDNPAPRFNIIEICGLGIYCWQGPSQKHKYTQAHC